MNDKKYLYVVFSITPFAIGKFIRFVTRYNYNHVSVGLTSDLSELYSFARFFKNAPLHGGFTHESLLRFENKGKYASIKICAIPINEAQLAAAEHYINDVRLNSSSYVYNILSAIFSLFKKKVIIPRSFTCLEFAVETLSKSGAFEVDTKKFYSIKDLDELLKSYIIYEGSILPYSKKAVWGSDMFLQRKTIPEIAYLTAYSYWTVLKLYLTN